MRSHLQAFPHRDHNCREFGVRPHLLDHALSVVAGVWLVEMNMAAAMSGSARPLAYRPLE
jgi:hypothetical protein